MTVHLPAITGLILAGGRGSRMGGVDKGLQLHQGRMLVRHVVDRLAPQVSHVLINANRSGTEYATLGYPVVADRIAGFAGPLAGLHAALAAAETPLVVTAPCDSPRLPHDLVGRLRRALLAGHANLAIVTANGRLHPVFCLCKREVLPHLTEFLAGGGRKIDRWYATLKVVEVAFDDEADAFENINTREELGRFETPDR